MQGRLHVWADREVTTDSPRDVFAEELTEAVRVDASGMHPLALRQDDRLLVAIGSCRDEAATGPVLLGGLLEDDRTYRYRHWASEKVQWSDWREAAGRDLAVVGVRIEARGFHLLELCRRA